MKRSAPPHRKAYIARTAITGKRARRIRPNAKRQAKNHERAYGSPERIAWVASLPCVVVPCRTGTPIENMHTATGGTSRKGDASTVVPCCRAHHREAHQMGVRSFSAKYALNLPALAAETDHRYTLEHAA